MNIFTIDLVSHISFIFHLAGSGGVALLAGGLEGGGEGNFITLFFIALTYIGSEFFYMLVIPPLYWLNRKEGSRVMFMILSAMYTGFLLKEIFRMPRPPQHLWLVGDVYGYGFPSGHSLLAFAFWTYFALTYLHHHPGKRIPPLAALTLAALISFSRIYLRVHYTVDVIGGAIIGILFALLFYYIHVNDIIFSREFSRSEIISLALTVPLNLYFLGIIAIGSLDYLLIYKLSLLCGTIAGAGVGIALGHEFSNATRRDMIRRIGIGLPAVIIAYLIPLIIPFAFQTILTNIIAKWLQGAFFALSALILVPVLWERMEE